VNGVVVQSQSLVSSSPHTQPTYELPVQQPPSYKSLSPVNASILTQLLTSSQGEPSTQLPLATSAAAMFVPNVVFLSRDGAAVTQSISNNAVSLPRPQLSAPSQPQFQHDFTNQLAADLNAFTSGVCVMFPFYYSLAQHDRLFTCT